MTASVGCLILIGGFVSFLVSVAVWSLISSRSDIDDDELPVDSGLRKVDLYGVYKSGK